MERRVISPAGLAYPNVPLSPAIRVGDLVFCSGQVGIDPKTRKLADGLEAQTRQCLENLKTVLEAAGSSLQNVDKCLVFITDISQFDKMNQIYRTYFPKDPPGRSCVEVSALASKDMLVEIECVAHV